MKRETKLTSEEQIQQRLEEQTEQQSTLEFASAEEMLRHDTLQTPVPPTVAERLTETLGRLPPPPPRSWWRRLLGK